MTGIGIEKPTTGNGRSPLDDRLITAAQYTVGVLRGCNIVTSSANLTYKISRGSDPSNVAVGSASDADGNVIFPITDGITVTTVKGDQTNPRIDSVYAVQHNPQAGDADANVVLVVVNGIPSATPIEPSAPAGIAVKLQSFQVPAGATTTSACSTWGDVDFSVQAQGAQGMLWQWTDTFNGLADQSGRDLGYGTLKLETDRWIRMSISPTISAVDNAHSGTCVYHLNMDWPSANQIVVSFELSYDGHWQTTYKPVTVKVPKGTHKFWFYRYKRDGDDFYQHYGSQNGEFYQGTVFMVEDLGAAV